MLINQHVITRKSRATQKVERSKRMSRYQAEKIRNDMIDANDGYDYSVTYVGLEGASGIASQMMVNAKHNVHHSKLMGQIKSL